MIVPGGRPVRPGKLTPVFRAHTLEAFWNVGLFLFWSGFPERIRLPFALGSGKSGIPLARMHSASFTTAAGLGLSSDRPPRNAAAAAARYERQYWPGPELPCPPLYVPSYPPGIAGSQGMSINLLTVTVGSA